MNPKSILLLLISVLFIVSCRGVKNGQGTIQSAKTITKDTTTLLMTINDSMAIDSNNIVLSNDSISIDSSSNIAFLDSTNIVMDSVEIARLEAERLEMEEAKRIKAQKTKALETDIENLKKRKNKAQKKYQEKHKLLERYLKVEATNRLLDINYYSATANRSNRNLTGLQFLVNSNFPQNLSQNILSNNTEKLVLSVISALNRYQNISEIDYNKLNTSIEIQCYGANPKLQNSIKSAFDKLGLPCQFVFSEGNNITLQIQFFSNVFFEQDFKEWSLEEQRINRKIRIKEIKINDL